MQHAVAPVLQRRRRRRRRSRVQVRVLITHFTVRLDLGLLRWHWFITNLFSHYRFYHHFKDNLNLLSRMFNLLHVCVRENPVHEHLKRFLMLRCSCWAEWVPRELKISIYVEWRLAFAVILFFLCRNQFPKKGWTLYKWKYNWMIWKALKKPNVEKIYQNLKSIQEKGPCFTLHCKLRCKVILFPSFLLFLFLGFFWAAWWCGG